MRDLIDRLRKIRAVILYGDTTAARWWERQYVRASAELDALRASINGEPVFSGAEGVPGGCLLGGDCGREHNTPVAASESLSPESPDRGGFRWYSLGYRVGQAERDALRAEVERLQRKRDARGRFVK